MNLFYFQPLLLTTSMETAIIAIACVVALIIFLWMVPVGLWFTALISGVHVSLVQLILMRWRKVPPGIIVNAMITGAKAGIPLNRDELMDDLDYYPEEYLNRLAQEGINGLWLTAEFKDLCRTSFTPDSGADSEKRLAKLKEEADKETPADGADLSAAVAKLEQELDDLTRKRERLAGDIRLLDTQSKQLKPTTTGRKANSKKTPGSRPGARKSSTARTSG